MGGKEKNTAFKFDVVDDVLVVDLKGPNITDPNLIDTLDKQLAALPAQTDRKAFVIDLEHIDAMATRFINCLLVMLKSVREEGGNLKFCNLQPDVERIFKLMRLHQVFDIYHSRDEAIASF